MLYGSDWPFAPEVAVAYFNGPIQDAGDIRHRDARLLFHRLSHVGLRK